VRLDAAGFGWVRLPRLVNTWAISLRVSTVARDGHVEALALDGDLWWFATIRSLAERPSERRLLWRYASMRDTAAQFLRPGETIQVVFQAQTASPRVLNFIGYAGAVGDLFRPVWVRARGGLGDFIGRFLAPAKLNDLIVATRHLTAGL
jgi:hypothetical protein